MDRLLVVCLLNSKGERTPVGPLRSHQLRHRAASFSAVGARPHGQRHLNGAPLFCTLRELSSTGLCFSARLFTASQIPFTSQTPAQRRSPRFPFRPQRLPKVPIHPPPTPTRLWLPADFVTRVFPFSSYLVTSGMLQESRSRPYTLHPDGCPQRQPSVCSRRAAAGMGV